MPVRTALIVGLGSAGRRHLRHLHAQGVERFVLCRTGKGHPPPDDQDGGLPGELITETGLDAALGHGPQLAVIANPTALHMVAAIRCAVAGCHLLIEKPVSHTLDGCDELLDVVDRLGLVAAVGCQFRFHPQLVTIRNEVLRGGDGRLPELTTVLARWGEWLPGWHPWEDYRGSYAAREDLGGGVIRTLIHPLDYLHWLLGPGEFLAGEVAKAETLDTDVPDDVAALQLRHRLPDGREAGSAVMLDFVKKPAVHTLLVGGRSGSVMWDYHAATLTWLVDGKKRVDRLARFKRDDLFAAQTRDLLRCIETGERPRCPLRDGVDVLRLALDARRYSDRHE